MLHQPCLIFFQNDQYLSSFQVILSPKSKGNDKKLLVLVGWGLKIFLDPTPYTKIFLDLHPIHLKISVYGVGV